MPAKLVKGSIILTVQQRLGMYESESGQLFLNFEGPCVASLRHNHETCDVVIGRRMPSELQPSDPYDNGPDAAYPSSRHDH